ncbi:MAG: sirohydrochlorin cobaltochelatase [Thermodesulfobacteriota bacterium]
MRKVSSIQKAILAALILFGWLILPAGPAAAGEKERPEKTGLLLAAFGTSVPEARAALDHVEKKIKAAFPGLEVRWAYTSRIIRAKLAKEGLQYDSVAEALARMGADGFTKVAVQSLHTIPGLEYQELVETARALAGLPDLPDRIEVGEPLLFTSEDVGKTMAAILANLPAERKPDEAVVLMGHGTHHPADAFYPALQYYFWKKDPHIFVGTVEGAPSLAEVREELEKRGLKKVWLLPFMSVAGDHALNDLAGPEEDSWKSILTKAGLTCVPVLKGTAEYEEIVDLWVGHLEVALSRLE